MGHGGDGRRLADCRAVSHNFSNRSCVGCGGGYSTPSNGIQICSTHQCKIHVIQSGHRKPSFHIEEPATLTPKSHRCVHSLEPLVDFCHSFSLPEPDVPDRILMYLDGELPLTQTFIAPGMPAHLTGPQAGPGLGEVCTEQAFHLPNRT